jgi:preprotein translocase subunit SecF
MEFLKPGIRLDLIGKRVYAAVASVIILGFSLASFVWPGPNWGIDFVGGTEIQARFEKEIKVGELRSAINSLGLGDVQIQRLGALGEASQGEQDFLIRVERLGAGEEAEDIPQKRVSLMIEEKLNEVVGAGKYLILQVNYVGPRVGKELKSRGIQAIIYAIIGILVYVAIRFEFRFSLGAVVALTHDAIISIGVFVAIHKEFNLAIIAALLAIIGYSVNDTIVIFDRIRENMRRLKRIPFIEMINVSVNETLSRTLLTSFTTLIAVISLYILGGGIIRDFSLIMGVGIIIGTYSSVYVASSLVVFWEGFRARRRTTVPSVPKRG